jgi:hypothetical protein
MTQYLLSVHTGDDAQGSMTEEEQRAGFAAVAELEADMTSAGALLFSGRLAEPGAARVVRSGKGRVRTTDGPYLEAKEAIGGFYIIEAADLDSALRWAERTSAVIHMPIEVRPFFDARRT